MDKDNIESTDRIAAIRNLLKAQQWLGLWKFPKQSILKRVYPYLLHLPFTFTFIALMWLEVLRSDSLEQAGQVLYMSLTELVLLVKIINIWCRRQAAWDYINKLSAAQIFALHTEEELLSWQQEQRAFRRVFNTFFAGSLFVIMSGYVSVLLQENYELPFGYYVPFEWRNPQRYYYAWGYNVAAMSLSCASNCLLDAMGCYFMLHIAQIYNLLNQRLLRLQQSTEQQALAELRRIFRLHKQVRIAAKQCEQLVSPYVLSQVVLSAFIICFSAYRLVSIGWQNPGLYLGTLQFMGVMIIEIFLPCYYGNQLSYNANQLTNSVFNTNWLHFSVATRKLLICYMEYLKRPVRLRAGNFFEIGMPIFVKTINNAYSVFALLLNLSK